MVTFCSYSAFMKNIHVNCKPNRYIPPNKSKIPKNSDFLQIFFKYKK